MRRAEERTPVRQGRYHTLTAADSGDLLAHFQSLSVRQRIARFHGAMSDGALAAYVQSIDWENHWIVADGWRDRMSSIVELIAYPPGGWNRCELALSLVSPQQCSYQVAAELIQIALLTAKERGASTIVSIWHGRDPALALLRSLSELASSLRIDQDQALIDLQGWFDGAELLERA